MTTYHDGSIVFLMSLASVFVIYIITSKIDVKRTGEEQSEYDSVDTKNNQAMARWNNTFSCTACGHRFIP